MKNYNKFLFNESLNTPYDVNWFDDNGKILGSFKTESGLKYLI
jgi:hypothetical protein